MHVLDMPNCQLTVTAAVTTLQALADAFRVNKTITHVNLSKNNFGDEGLKARLPRRGHGRWFVEQWDSEGRRLQCGRGVV